MTNKNDILMMNNIIGDLGYTGEGDKNPTEKHFSQQYFLNFLKKFKTKPLMKL